jgi:hypothetical protein
MNPCFSRPIIAVNISWTGAPFDWTQELDAQVGKFRRAGLTIGHTMMLLLDTRHKTIEFFEPNGPHAPWVKVIVPALHSYFRDIPEFAEYKFIDPAEGQYCPRSGLQFVSQDQMCANWSMLYAVLRASCPDITSADLIEMLRSRWREYLRFLMQSWSCYMWQYARENYIIEAFDAENDFARNTLRPNIIAGLYLTPADLEILRVRFYQAYESGDFQTAVIIDQAYDEVLRIKALHTSVNYEPLDGIYRQMQTDLMAQQYADVMAEAKAYDRLYAEINPP